MKLIDAIEAWGVEHRSDLTDTELRRLGTFWATLSNSDIGDRPIAFLTDGDADQAAGLFTWTDKSDVLELLDTVRGWHLGKVAASAPSAANDAVAAPVPAMSEEPDQSSALDDLDLGFAFDDPGDTPLPGANVNKLQTSAPQAFEPSPLPAESVGAESTAAEPAARDRGDLRLLQLGALLLVAIVLVGVVITVGFGGDDGAIADTDNVETTAEAAASTEVLGTTAEAQPEVEIPAVQAPTLEAIPDPAQQEAVSYPPLESLPERQAFLRDGKLYLEGPQPNQAYADAVVSKAVEVMGAENVVDNYVIHPDAPPPLDGSVLIEQGVFFEADSAIISEQFIPVLQLGILLMDLNPLVTMLIEGHTDSTGDAGYNRELSLRRANSVADWMSVNGSIDRARFETRGYGPDEPVADNSTDEGKAANRRIEVQIFGLLAS